jgi:hypothetical protein
MQAPPEKLAFTLMLSPDGSQPDGLASRGCRSLVQDSYGQIVHQVIMPNTGDEFHHFGWNACSSALSPLTGHAFLERRYLIIPGIRSSAHLRHRREGAAEGQDPQDHRTRRGVRQDRLFPPPHHPLRARRHLCLDAWRRR